VRDSVELTCLISTAEDFEQRLEVDFEPDLVVGVGLDTEVIKQRRLKGA